MGLHCHLTFNDFKTSLQNLRDWIPGYGGKNREKKIDSAFSSPSVSFFLSLAVYPFLHVKKFLRVRVQTQTSYQKIPKKIQVAAKIVETPISRCTIDLTTGSVDGNWAIYAVD